MNTKIIKLDLNRRLYDKIIAKQGDTKSRFLLFQLLDGSIAFNLTNRSVRAYMIKPDGKEIFNDLIIDNYLLGYCTLELTNQVLAVPGTVKIELMVTEEDRKLTSFVLELEVIKSINSEKSIVSTNEFTALLNGLSSLSEYDNYKNEIAAARDGEVNLLTKVKKIDSQLDNIKSNSIISFIFDDGFVEDNKTYELFKSKNMLCNFALVKDWTKALNKNFVDNYRKYQNEGFGILSHTSTHADLRSSGISQYNAEYEIAKSLELNKYDFRISGFVAAQSSIHEDYMHFVEQNYDFAFTRYRGVLSGDKKGHYSKKEDVHRLWRISIESNSLEDLKTCIDNCISEKGFLVLYGHQLDTTNGLTTKKLTALLDYINNLDCEVLNIYNAMSKYFGININNETGFDESKYVNILNISNNNGLSSELSFNKLFLYNHDDDKGDNVVINGNRITLGYTSELSEGKVTTLQGKISLSDVDMNYIENQKQKD